MHRIFHALTGLAIALALTCPTHAAANGFSVGQRSHIAGSPDFKQTETSP